MHYGLALPLSGINGSIERLVDYACAAEAAGWDGVFLEDYLVYWERAQVTFDPWLVLTAIAMHTSRIRLGITVVPLPVRQPWKVAREAVTLDHLSQGRLILGCGLGDLQDSYFGENSDLKQRGAMLDEGLTVLAGLLSGQPFSYQGTYYQVRPLTFRPAPFQQPHIPIWIGGFWPRRAPARRAARWDGFCPAKLAGDGEDGLLTPGDVTAIRRFLLAERGSLEGFDLVVGGSSPQNPVAARRQVLQFAEAGATWWVEFILPSAKEAAETLHRIQQGPPR
ncbi:MAG: LLM class flavin-dependent oxidoreductase [Thermogemmatispora sp.]|jgi:alkanesulfonate monooxygenase SsuD/methylene tetrahydromethanopterin reductase-like flavin-dependent oxidoreductase (luciferase family)|uniref:Luciferase-like protein n=1 Tax=Thermogemmatispora aurantia TaxID=2045279 RepID=A0A5J4KCX0_9CHLR|nr:MULTISPECIES: LLM class flavin-dependent oxidoreductase [Thermogemmatispora]MBE3567523.1 LLM class flavin-dependent oxidoreductase [Thermogemmatispora sp.]GER85393.1 luciferase-like protein [Thermogemmatispora aurantia]